MHLHLTGTDPEDLAGCGLLGEVACDGTREVGLFWRDVLGWPLVWEHDQEIAIQSPHGGTKVAWGGPPVAPLVAGAGSASTSPSSATTRTRRPTACATSAPPGGDAGTTARRRWPTRTGTSSPSGSADT